MYKATFKIEISLKYAVSGNSNELQAALTENLSLWTEI